MSKSTKASGATFTDYELADPRPPETVVRVTRAMLGGEPQSVGMNSSQSSQSEQQPSGEPNSTLRQPAPMTENPSNQSEEVPSSDVDSTDGPGRTTDQGSAEDTDDFELETEDVELETEDVVSNEEGTESAKPATPKRTRARSTKSRATVVDEFDDF